ncbi:uncharacterized protein LOC133189817 [Saccostrea echinata]|uniref:uncharacterized protein LOC133189817 n=1 Tax=Saccostrea echinata TaxID=191078 RepID=UPI002A7F5D91|nr:uncharacterized protein LOC133189817 [Saccostrea echinata]
MTESSASVNSGELTVKGVVDWASSVFEDEDKEFTYSCQLERNAKRSERQENVEDKETDQPISIKDAPHLNKEEIKSEFPISQNVEEFKEPTVKLDRLPENVSLPTDSGYCSAANSLDKSLNNEEQLSSYTGDNKNSSHTFRRTSYPLPWMYMHELPENMRIEWLRVYSFATFSSQKISNFLLAKHGFYFDKDKGKIQCFACDKSYKWEELENTEDCNVKLKTSLHEDWCLIADGNVPIHPSPVNSLGISEGLPSCNKRKFKDEGRIITCLELCGLNTFFVDQGNMLKEFPVLIDKYENYNSGDGSINPFQVILTMLRKGERNSARGMREILLQTKLIKPSETTINQIHFELIRFVCELMKGKIIVKGKCGCPNEIVNKEEQIFIR